MSREKILVVEDDVNLLAGIRDILELDEYDVVTAENGEEGLNVLNNDTTPPDLIVSDIMMPEMDGIEFLTSIRENHRFLTIPFIFLTAKGEKQDIQLGKKLGVDDYVVKPFNAEDLLVAVESRLNRHRTLNQVHAGEVTNIRDNILTILNHEFRTPLTFVVAYADMLDDFSSDDNSGASDMVTFLQGVQSGAERLRRLIENFIVLVELETGTARNTFEFRKRPVEDVRPIFERAISATAKYHADDRPVELDIAADLPEFVGDEEFLTIALTHLIDNAFKFSDPGKPIHAGCRIEGDEVRFWVQDFGRGMVAEEHSKIWQTFYQIDRQQHEDQGAGSGLAIVRGIAKLHSGCAEVSSTVGEGSTFSLQVPVQP